MRCAATLQSRRLSLANSYRLYRQLERGIYVGAYDMNPATYGELIGYIDRVRASRFLDRVSHRRRTPV